MYACSLGGQCAVPFFVHRMKQISSLFSKFGDGKLRRAGSIPVEHPYGCGARVQERRKMVMMIDTRGEVVGGRVCSLTEEAGVK